MTSSRTPDDGRGPRGAAAGGEVRGARGRRTVMPRTRIGGSRAKSGGAQTGASWKGGDELVTAITARCGTQVVVLSGRQSSGGRVEFDHILVAPSGVWVVSAGRHNGRVDVVQPPLGRARLTIGGLDRTDLVEALDAQVDAVNQAMVRIDPRLQVRGALCVITPKGLLHDAGLPVIRPLEIRGYAVAPPKRVTKLLTADDAIIPLSPIERTRLGRALAQRFPAKSAG